MGHIAKNISEIRATLPPSVALVAVSKYYPIEAVAEAYAAGQRIFGESRAQEIREKAEALPKDIEWHFIGHLQPNKVKYIAPFISLIHAVDTPKLLAEINRQAEKCGRVIPCLLQLHVAAEETKYGFTPNEAWQFLESGEWRNYPNAQISGVMCMATNTDDEVRIRSDFHTAHDFFLRAKSAFFADNPHFTQCSWGMSDDYSIAISEGSTLVRIGSKIFCADDA
jgi:pyridoxal phosphate enzyme (YggS family)